MSENCSMNKYVYNKLSSDQSIYCVLTGTILASDEAHLNWEIQQYLWTKKRFFPCGYIFFQIYTDKACWLEILNERRLFGTSTYVRLERTIGSYIVIKSSGTQSKELYAAYRNKRPKMN